MCRLVYFSFCILAFVRASPWIQKVDWTLHVDPEHGRFLDEQGRTVILRGIVQMADSPGPWLNESQINTLVAYGFNVVRLGFVWHLYEIAPGSFNETYLDELARAAGRLASKGIRSILDSHQDWLSPMYCSGRGMPEFYAYPDATAEYFHGGSKAYPEPLMAPTYEENSSDPWAVKFGKVDASICAAMFGVGWPFSYNTYAVGRAMQRFYNDDDGVRTKYTEMWKRVATRFRDVPGVTFYEIFNEPWLGDTFADAGLLVPGKADVVNVEPLNQAVHEAIRTVDNDTVILYEPAVMANNSFATGLRAGPGGIEFDNLQAFAYHMYCPKVFGNTGACGAGDPDLDMSYVFDLRVEDTKRLRSAGFMSEFGAISENSAGLEYLSNMLDRADAEAVAWTYYQMVASPSIDQPNWEVKYLVRAYPQAVAGQLVDFHFDVGTKKFVIHYVPDPQGTTEVFASRHFLYRSGMDWDVTPSGALVGSYNGDVLSLSVAKDATLARGEAVEVTIRPKVLSAIV